MGFEFPLEAILRLRRGLERMERLKLEALASEQALARTELESISRELFESQRRFQERIVDDTFGSEIQFEELLADRVCATQRRLKMRISELEQLRLLQIGVFTNARQRREVLENLRDRKLAAYRQDVLRHEQQGLDDVFLMRQNRLRDE